MNKYLKLIIPAALLLTTSAFARENNSELFLKEKIFNTVPAEFAKNTKMELQKSYIENSTNKESIKENIKALCQGNKYCLTNVELMLRAGVSPLQTVETITETVNHKQALYNTKYSFAKKNYKTYETLQILELEQIVKLNSFAEFKDYITDMPLLDDSLKSALELLDLYATYSTSSKEEADALYEFKQAFPKNLPVCSKNLDMNKYGYNNLCVLPENRVAKKHLVKEIEKVMKTIEIAESDANEFKEAQRQIKEILNAWKSTIK